MIFPAKHGALAMLALLIALPGLAQDAPAPITVDLGDVYADSLGSEGLHAYTMELESGYFVFGAVNQITVDVVVTVKDPEGEQVGEFDIPARGAEPFQFTTETAGAYRFEVTPFEEETGRYEFTLQLVEPEATTPAGKVDQVMSQYGDETPGTVVAIVRDGEV